MIEYTKLQDAIEARIADERKTLTEHYTSTCETEFMAAVEANQVFPITFKVPVHAIDADKRGATIIRQWFEKYGYRTVRTSYGTVGNILVEVHKNGTAFTRNNPMQR